MIPFASMSNETSICGILAGPGIPTSWNFPSVLLNETISDSPWATWISTEGWLSSAVVKVSDLRVGIVVFRSMSLVNTPPFVSIPSERCHVEQEDVLDVALEDASLDGCADGDDLVRVDALVRVLPDQLLDLLLDGRHAGHAADEDDVLDVGRGQPGVGERCLVGSTVRSRSACVSSSSFAA